MSLLSHSAAATHLQRLRLAHRQVEVSAARIVIRGARLIAEHKVDLVAAGRQVGQLYHEPITTGGTQASAGLQQEPVQNGLCSVSVQQLGNNW